MTLFQSVAFILTLTALFGYLNERFIRLPTPIGVTLVALVTSLGLVLFAGPGVTGWAEGFLVSIDFDELVLEGLLSFLLFAGSLHVNLEDLSRQRWPILFLATVGVATSTFVVGGLIFVVLGLLGLELPFIWALVFGALISPTDPIAVLGILRRLGVRKDIETLIVGESLFNDGVGVVVFLAVLGLATADGHGAGVGATIRLFVVEAGGGIALGLVLGYLAFLLIRRVDAYTVEILLTLALVTGGYALALVLHTSGPLAMVVAGLFIGNPGPDAGHERAHPRTPGHLLGADRRDLERGAVRAHRPRGAGGRRRVPLGRGAAGDPAGAGGEDGERGASDRAVANPQAAAAVDDPHHDLGRTSGRHLDRAGTVDPRRTGTNPAADHDLRGGGLRHPGPGTHRLPGRRQDPAHRPGVIEVSPPRLPPVGSGRDDSVYRSGQDV